MQFATLSNNQEPPKPPRPTTLSLPLTNNFSCGSGPGTNRINSHRANNVQNNANNIINFGGNSARSGGKSLGVSPALTGRATPTIASKKAMVDYQADIDMVRQLM